MPDECIGMREKRSHQRRSDVVVSFFENTRAVADIIMMFGLLPSVVLASDDSMAHVPASVKGQCQKSKGDIADMARLPVALGHLQILPLTVCRKAHSYKAKASYTGLPLLNPP